MSTRKDYTGQIFSRLTALSFARAEGGKTFWKLQCSCGEVVERNIHSVTSGAVQSCRCLLKENKSQWVHGGYGTSEYQTWSSFRSRCLNPNNKDYANYGGRGITVDPAWDSFEQFLKDMGPRPKGLTLDRRENDGPYSALNCRWATRSEQQQNRRVGAVPKQHHSILKTFAGSNRELGRQLGVTHATIASWKRKLTEK